MPTTVMKFFAGLDFEINSKFRFSLTQLLTDLFKKIPISVTKSNLKKLKNITGEDSS
jgi:hypothetical protein